jgi:hypothetical protein
MNEEERRQIVKEHHQAMGRKGGGKNKEKGREYFSKIGKMGMEARWGNKPVDKPLDK